MSAALLAKLTAKGVAMDGAGFGGVPNLTSSDVAGAMAGLTPPVYQLLRLKYCGEEEMRPVVVERVAFSLLGYAMTGDIDLKVSTVRNLAALVVDLVMKGALCGSCGGTGMLITDATAKDCGVCRGSGRANMTQKAAADFLGIDKRTYTKNYDRLVVRFCADLEAMEASGLAHVRRQIFPEINEN